MCILYCIFAVKNTKKKHFPFLSILITQCNEAEQASLRPDIGVVGSRRYCKYILTPQPRPQIDFPDTAYFQALPRCTSDQERIRQKKKKKRKNKTHKTVNACKRGVGMMKVTLIRSCLCNEDTPPPREAKKYINFPPTVGKK